MNERFGEHYQPVPNSSSQIIVDKAMDKSGSDVINQDLSRGVIWCHAVSLGELNTAYPLLKNLINQGFKLWITSTTQTGFNRVSQLFADKLGVVVNHSFVPVDNLAVVQRFINHVRPVMAIFIETELWATMLHELSQQGIPSVMVNARLTQKIL